MLKACRLRALIDPLDLMGMWVGREGGSMERLHGNKR